VPFSCPSTETYEWDVNEDPADSDWPVYSSLKERDENESLFVISNISSIDESSLLLPRWLDKRGNQRRPLRINLIDPVTLLQIVLILYARAYPGPSTILNGRNGAAAYGFAFRYVQAS